MTYQKEFIQLSKAWYGEYAMPNDVLDEIQLRYAEPSSNGVLFEFIIEWCNLNDSVIVPRVRVFNDAWQAFEVFADLFSYLVTIADTQVSPDAMASALEAMGYINTTPIENLNVKLLLSNNAKEMLGIISEYNATNNPQLATHQHIMSDVAMNHVMSDAQALQAIAELLERGLIKYTDIGIGDHLIYYYKLVDEPEAVANAPIETLTIENGEGKIVPTGDYVTFPQDGNGTVCPDCKGRGWYPIGGNLKDTCSTCDGEGIL